MDASGSQKFKIKIGNAEFEAEGPTDLLKDQFERFMTVVEKIGQPVVAPAVVPAPTVPTVVGAAASVVPAAPNPPANPSITGTTNGGVGNGADPAAPIGDDLLARMFRRDADAVSLLALPRTEDGGTDALVLLLYGYQRLMSRNSVNGYTLIRAARQSGVSMDRVDTAMAKRTEYVLAAGAKRGRVYSLNNRGVAYAEGVLRRTLE